MTWPALSSTGNALTRYSRKAAAIAANGVSCSTQITWVVIASLTKVLMALPFSSSGTPGERFWCLSFED